MKHRYCADFETTTESEDCRVWAYSVTEIGNTEFFKYGTTIESFMKLMKNHNDSTFYFHNLKFDGEFIMNYLFRNGFVHTEEKILKIINFQH